MPDHRTKSEQILALHDGKRTPREIADIVGCRPEYVRVVARQRRGSGMSDIDRRYVASPKGQRTAARMAHLKVSAKAAYNRVLYRSIPKPERGRLYRNAKHAALAAGKSPAEAHAIGCRAIWRSALANDRTRRAARAAYRSVRQEQSHAA